MLGNRYLRGLLVGIGEWELARHPPGRLGQGSLRCVCVYAGTRNPTRANLRKQLGVNLNKDVGSNVQCLLFVSRGDEIYPCVC